MEKDRTEEGQDIKKGRRGSGRGGNEEGRVIAKSRVRCLKNKKRSRRFGDQKTVL